MAITEAKKPADYSDKIAACLERSGWLKSVAGEHDFNLAVKGINESVVNKRGLLLVGEAGVGKTFLLKILRGVYHPYHPFWLSCASSSDLRKMQDTSDDTYLGKRIFIDDVGVEQEQIVNYQKTDCFSKFIQWFHDMDAGGRVYISTNLNAEQINARYGGRILDRLLEMCVVVKFTGSSKRERVIVK